MQNVRRPGAAEPGHVSALRESRDHLNNALQILDQAKAPGYLGAKLAELIEDVGQEIEKAE